MERDIRPRENLSYILLMAEILHQLRLVVLPIICRVSYIQTVVVWDVSHQQYDLHSNHGKRPQDLKNTIGIQVSSFHLQKMDGFTKHLKIKSK